jgi:hypothetical protein
LAEVLAPRTLERFLGIRHHGFLLRVMDCAKWLPAWES